MRQSPKTLRALFKDLVAFCLLGCVSGAGVGFFIFLRLGFPNRSEHLAGYICGLFFVAGLKFGIAVWFIRIVGWSMLELWSSAGSCASSYAFKNMDLNCGSQVPQEGTRNRHISIAPRPDISRASVEVPPG
jgi:hypothetical protein